jgi:hypothetical protein
MFERLAGRLKRRHDARGRQAPTSELASIADDVEAGRVELPPPMEARTARARRAGVDHPVGAPLRM